MYQDLGQKKSGGVVLCACKRHQRLGPNYDISQIYDGCSKRNISFFVTLVHDIRGSCWWYGSREWTFPPIPRYIFLPCDRWQQRGTLTQWHLTWKCVWSKGVELNSSMRKEKSPPDACWMCMEAKHWVWEQGGRGWWVTAVVTTTRKTIHILDSHTQLPYHEMKCFLISTSRKSAIGGNYVEKISFCSWEFTLVHVIVLFVTDVISTKINRRHYFQSDLCIFSHSTFPIPKLWNLGALPSSLL